MKCGECLFNHAKMIDLVDGICPNCGADYRSNEAQLENELKLEDIEKADQEDEDEDGGRLP